jgi:subtilisin-like proprotein convertase family protein
VRIVSAALCAAALALALPARAQTYISTDVPKTIPDSFTSAGVSTLTVPDSFVIGTVQVKLSILYGTDADIDIFLRAPGGQQLELSTDNGGSGDNYVDTLFTDAAAFSITSGAAPFTGSFRPEQPLSTLSGTDALGQWQLRVTDDTILGGPPGTIQSWSLIFTPAIAEPEMYAMLLTGFSLLGFAARCRKRSF